MIYTAWSSCLATHSAYITASFFPSCCFTSHLIFPPLLFITVSKKNHSANFNPPISNPYQTHDQLQKCGPPSSTDSSPSSSASGNGKPTFWASFWFSLLSISSHTPATFCNLSYLQPCIGYGSVSWILPARRIPAYSWDISTDI